MIAIIKYNGGNVYSVQNSVNRLGFDSLITDNLKEILKADKVILPGVGEASTAMTYLKSKGLDQLIVNIDKPILGICLGMQLMCNYTEEGNVIGLGIFNTKVKLFEPLQKVPHTGWNNCLDMKTDLFTNVKVTNDVYFVHSYYAELCEDTVANCDYIQPFSAALQKNNFYGTQFHPEKSGSVGEQILKNFLEIKK
jgi:glutamine amidotransferase